MFIKVNQWQIFQRSDIALNDIHDHNERNRDPAPDFVAKFERMLDRKPGLRPDVACLLDPEPRAAYFETREDSTIEDESHEEMQQPLRYAEQLEALHIAHVVSYEWQTLWHGGGTRTLKEYFVNAMFFLHLLCVSKNKTTIVHCGHKYVLTYIL
jgi:hypothetical protein